MGSKQEGMGSNKQEPGRKQGRMKGEGSKEVGQNHQKGSNPRKKQKKRS